MAAVPVWTPTFAIGVLVLAYLTSFVAFAILRIATGISIQRIGYLSLRRIAYTVRDGLQLELRGIGVHLHRPTYSRPTWVTLRIDELKLLLDPAALQAKDHGTPGNSSEDASDEAASDAPLKPANPPLDAKQPGRFWRMLSEIKERLKRIHDKIDWICMVDLEAINTGIVLANIGHFQITHLTLGVDTRKRKVDRGRLFRHKEIPEGDNRPAEWTLVIKNILFVAHGKESVEILDVCSINVHGILLRRQIGLRDTSISLKLGRVHIPYDDLANCHRCLRRQRRPRSTSGKFNSDAITEAIAPTQNAQPPSSAPMPDQRELRTFASSLLRGIQEVQLAISFIGATKRIVNAQDPSRPLFVNFAMNEFGIDMFRLDNRSPAHRMYFPPNETAHQALLAAISIAVSINDDVQRPERLLYVPMATTTVKTTLPSKALKRTSTDRAEIHKGAILIANLVLTSPSLDMGLKHMPIILAWLQPTTSSTQTSRSNSQWQDMLAKYLPQATVRISIQEPVGRIVLPRTAGTADDPGDYDLLISSTSLISFDIDSSHSTEFEHHYSLSSNFRVATHQFYFQAADGTQSDLLRLETFQSRIHLSASPVVSLNFHGTIETLSVYLTRADIVRGLREIVQHVHHAAALRMGRTTRKAPGRVPTLRQLPSWVSYVQLRGSSFTLEIAGEDEVVSEQPRGVALHLETWQSEYSSRPESRHGHRPQISRTPSMGQHIDGASSPRLTQSPSLGPSTSTDGRRLVAHVNSFNGFAIDNSELWDSEPLFSLPKLEAILTTSSDSRGPLSDVHVHSKATYFQVSLYKYYAVSVAQEVVKRTLLPKPGATDLKASRALSPERQKSPKRVKSPARTERPETWTLDTKFSFVQVKIQTPRHPELLLQIDSLEGGFHRWAAPFVRIRSTRLCAEAPRTRQVWARLVLIKFLRIDFREARRKYGQEMISQESLDLTCDFLRLSVPHQFILHRVFDNVTGMIKAVKQLRYRFATHDSSTVLKKGPEGPKRVPRISLRARNFMFELEDGIFDWRLGAIFRLGLSEQKQRMARQEAYEVKKKRMESRARPRDSTMPKPAVHNNEKGERRGRNSRLFRSQASHAHTSSALPSQGSKRASQSGSRQMRYDAEGISDLTDSARIPASEAWLRLQKLNAANWKKRIDTALRVQQEATNEIRCLLGGTDDLRDPSDEPESILAMPCRPGLMSLTINDLHVMVDKPSFPPSDYAGFLNKVGKGMPLDTQYTLLIPMSIHINMGEARISLRNYPLPLLHVPAIRPGQPPRLPSWSLKTDLVIAEEYRGEDSVQYSHVEIIPAAKNSTDGSEPGRPYGVDICRTVSPVKTYSNVEICVNTSGSTSISWGTSLQPAIQDTMQIIETFTRPQADPSERVGFWDKVRLVLHSRAHIAWKGNGDVHLRLKGSRDPYVVTGQGAGFVMCFRKGVIWDIHREDDPRKFMAVSCDEYFLAIPDYSPQARHAHAESKQDPEKAALQRNRSVTPMFKKVVMKLSGRVLWLAGLVFERDVASGGRSFKSIPHYAVVLKRPDAAKAENGLAYDAFRGFRSQYIHLSLAVSAPHDRHWSVDNAVPSEGYNSLHLTPRFFTHFFAWWGLFSAPSSMPIRQGKLFMDTNQPSKKFGRHLATIKYNLLLSPFFASHIYKHKDKEDLGGDVVSATGLKARLDSFMLDLHQRREQFATRGDGRLKITKTSSMRINQAQLDFLSADIRAVSAEFEGVTSDQLKSTASSQTSEVKHQGVAVDPSQFSIPDNDTVWIDMDDFVELDWTLPYRRRPEIHIMPLAFAPRFTYLRQTDLDQIRSGGVECSSTFGDEPTHFCILSSENDPQKVQNNLLGERIASMESRLEDIQKRLNEVDKSSPSDQNENEEAAAQIDRLLAESQLLTKKISFLESLLGSAKFENGDSPSFENFRPDGGHASPISGMGDFHNRFIIHNVQLKWNNSLRNIILRYVHQVSQRRGFVYYMSRRAVRFIIDTVKEQQRGHRPASADPKDGTQQRSSSAPASPVNEREELLEDRIEELLKDGKSFVSAEDPEDNSSLARASKSLDTEISEEYIAQNSYRLRLIAPQIQLQSEKNPRAVLIVAAKGMDLRVVQIMDKNRMRDEVSGLVQRRFSLDMDSVQFFVTNQKSLKKYTHLISANRYGTVDGSAWPPWLSVEVNFDFALDPPGWSRVVSKTSASLRYDKYNTLRLKYNAKVNKQHRGQGKAHESEAESRMDHLWVEFPHIRAVCDSSSYYSLYVIVLDLLLYSEPLEKIRSEKLEKIMLAADFSDLSGAPEMVICLQDRIRQLEEIKMQFQLFAEDLDREGWQDRYIIEKDLTNYEDELFFMMKAITTSQRKFDDRGSDSQSSGLLRWYLSAAEVVWLLLREDLEPLVEVQLKYATYDRIDNSDGSNYNILEIERIHALNLVPDAIYPEMVSPYMENGKGSEAANMERLQMVKVRWLMLEAIAGIPVLDQFEVNMFPLKIQLERDIGQKIFEYVFPGHRQGDELALEGSDLDFEVDTIDSSSTDDEGPSHQALPQKQAATSHRAADSPKTLKSRLKPTLNLPTIHSADNRSTKIADDKSWTSGDSSSQHYPPSSHGSVTSSARVRSYVSLTHLRGSPRQRSTESLHSSLQPSTAGPRNTSSLTLSSERSKRSKNHKNDSRESLTAKERPSDDLSQMMSRASNYMTLAYVKIPSVVLCLSYKGRGERNLEDVHNFVFRMPALEYRNKTWSNLDLALRLKKEVIKALISHTGAIIGNKLSHRRPPRPRQSRLKELLGSSSILNRTNSHQSAATTLPSEPNPHVAPRKRPTEPHTDAFVAGWGQHHRRSQAATSSHHSLVSPNNTYEHLEQNHSESAASSQNDDASDRRTSNLSGSSGLEITGRRRSGSGVGNAGASNGR